MGDKKGDVTDVKGDIFNKVLDQRVGLESIRRTVRDTLLLFVCKKTSPILLAEFLKSNSQKVVLI